jgi:hypothetical protein
MTFEQIVSIVRSYGIENDTAEHIAQAILNYEIYGEEEENDPTIFQIVYMYNSDKTIEHIEEYTANELDDARSDYKYFVTQKDCSYVVLQMIQIINGIEEKYILEEYHLEESSQYESNRTYAFKKDVISLISKEED